MGPSILGAARSAFDLGDQPSDLARPGWLDLASTGSIWLPTLALGAQQRVGWLDLAANTRPWASILLRMGSVFMDFAAQGQCFVKVALVASIWVLCALLGALAASI